MKIQRTVLFITIALLLPSLRANGQHYVVTYQYDDSGNRVCQRAMQVTPYNPKTGFGDSMAQNVSSQSDTVSQTQFSRLYSQTTLAIKNDEKDHMAKAWSKDSNKIKSNNQRQIMSSRSWRSLTRSWMVELPR